MPLLLAGAALVRVAIERQWGSATSLSITLPLGALALACLLTTFMLGRLASEARIAAILAGVLTMTVAAWALALTQGALSSLPQALGSLLVLLAAAASSGWAGHRLAARGRHQIP